MISAFLFDLDGTLTLTEELKIASRVESVARFGGNITRADVLPFVGTSEASVTTGLIAASGIDVKNDELSKAFEEIYFAKIKAGVDLIPGAREFLLAARERGIALALVTASSIEMLHNNPTLRDILPLFVVIITSSDKLNAKPDPEPYLVAMDRLKVRPDTAIAFEDSIPGKTSSTSAGLPTVFIRHSINAATNVSDAIADTDHYSPALLDDLLMR